MKKVKTGIKVRTQFEGFHVYENAPEEVEFLKSVHRHMFKVELDIETFDNDRELEFFIVQRILVSYVKQMYAGKTFKKGCEQIAEEIARYAGKKLGENRRIIVTVSEDGENDGYVVLVPEDSRVQK